MIIGYHLVINLLRWKQWFAFSLWHITQRSAVSFLLLFQECLLLTTNYNQVLIFGVLKGTKGTWLAWKERGYSVPAESVLRALETSPECISKPPKVKGLIANNLQDVRFSIFSPKFLNLMELSWWQFCKESGLIFVQVELVTLKILGFTTEF